MVFPWLPRCDAGGVLLFSLSANTGIGQGARCLAGFLSVLDSNNCLCYYLLLKQSLLKCYHIRICLSIEFPRT